jgi:hypothetical protein
MVSTVRSSSLTVIFAAKSGVLKVGAKKTLQAFAKKLAAGDSVIVTGYAKDNSVLAKSRAKTAAHYLSSWVKVHVTLERHQRRRRQGHYGVSSRINLRPGSFLDIVGEWLDDAIYAESRINLRANALDGGVDFIG